MGRFSVCLSKERFLLIMSFIYLFAFASLYIQLPGLYSKNGILPVDLVHMSVPKDAVDFIQNPNLLRLSSFIKLDVYQFLEFLVLLGTVMSFVAAFFSSWRTAPTFFALWIMYFSAFQVGQAFLWFQWDLMLLEAGFLAFLLSSFGVVISLPRKTASDRIGMWLVRWLLFRLMFSAGVVKLTSNCPSWWGLKALNWHYQSQCIPNPAAWYAHHLPDWFHSFCVACTLIIEIALPFLFFVPIHAVRLFSFYSQILLQVAIIFTGNFNFFNLMTIALCYSLLKDSDFGSYRRGRGGSRFFSSTLALILISVVLGFCAQYFNVSLIGNIPQISIKFTKSEFTWFVNKSLTYSMFVGVGLFFIELLCSIFSALRACGCWRKMYELVGVIFVGSVGLALVFGSLVPFSSLDPNVQSKMPPEIHEVYKYIRPYHLTNGYGLFRRMTGVGGRPELILEAASNIDGPWSEYEFRFKPGRLNRIPPLVIPHQPRLDWQMWFAALSTYQKQPWFMNLVYRLLNQQREVLGLLDPSGLPRNPKFIRAKLYTYYFTDSPDSKNWWTRTLKSEYLPAVSLSSATLRTTVEQNGLIGKRQPRPYDPTLLSQILDSIRQIIGQPADLSPLLIVCLVLILTKCAFTRACQTTNMHFVKN